MTVYCVFCNDNGGKFLESIFYNLEDAASYVQAQGKYKNMYHTEGWDVE
jgi:hypothetical protein